MQVSSDVPKRHEAQQGLHTAFFTTYSILQTAGETNPLLLAIFTTSKM